MTVTRPANPETPIAASPMPDATLTTKPSSIPKSTVTASAVPTVTATPTIPPQVLAYKQLDIENSLNAEQTIEGVVVFSSWDETYLWDAQTGVISYFAKHEHELLGDFEVSPDRTRILFWRGGLTMADAHGKVIWTLATNKPYYGSTNRLLWKPIYQSGKPAYWVVLDPATAKYNEVHQDEYANDLFNTKFDRPKWDFLALPIYDPGLTRAVYPECQPGCMNSYEQMIVLWDIAHKQVLARLTTRDYFGNTPVWSQNGGQFVIAIDSHTITTLDTKDQRDELYAISRDGQIRQLTHFTDYFDFLQIPNSYALSPDGRKVAFWMVPQPSPNDAGYLCVLDIETGQVMNYGIIGLPVERADSLARPIWSPNGEQLLFRSLDPVDGKTGRVIVVDTIHDYAVEIAKDVLPEAWMATGN